MSKRRSPQPARTFTEKVSLARPVEDHRFTLSYIKATADPNEAPDSGFWRAARRAQGSDRWAYHELATNHMIPLMEPEALVSLLLDITDA